MLFLNCYNYQLPWSDQDQKLSVVVVISPTSKSFCGWTAVTLYMIVRLFGYDPPVLLNFCFELDAFLFLPFSSFLCFFSTFLNKSSTLLIYCQVHKVCCYFWVCQHIKKPPKYNVSDRHREKSHYHELNLGNLAASPVFYPLPHCTDIYGTGINFSSPFCV